MAFPAQQQSFKFLHTTLQLSIPSPEYLLSPAFSQPPYWARLWPAALAMCSYLEKKQHIGQNKSILEIGAGLGLPGLCIASIAAEVLMTDGDENAVEFLEKNIESNRLFNAKTRVLNWEKNTTPISCDWLLLSDVNYNPDDFRALELLIKSYLNNGTNILLSTPERLLAKPFINALQAQIAHHARFEIDNQWISVYELHTNPL